MDMNNITNAAAATLLNILTALTLIVPVGISANEMTADDKLDARDTWDFFFGSVSSRAWLQSRGVEQPEGGTFYPGDGRTLRVWRARRRPPR